MHYKSLLVYFDKGVILSLSSTRMLIYPRYLVFLHLGVFSALLSTFPFVLHFYYSLPLINWSTKLAVQVKSRFKNAVRTCSGCTDWNGLTSAIDFLNKTDCLFASIKESSGFHLVINEVVMKLYSFLCSAKQISESEISISLSKFSVSFFGNFVGAIYPLQ